MGMVKMLKIGQSAAKHPPLYIDYRMNVQRLNGNGL